jgi:hypothetical protein
MTSCLAKSFLTDAASITSYDPAYLLLFVIKRIKLEWLNPLLTEFEFRAFNDRVQDLTNFAQDRANIRFFDLAMLTRQRNNIPSAGSITVYQSKWGKAFCSFMESMESLHLAQTEHLQMVSKLSTLCALNKKDLITSSRLAASLESIEPPLLIQALAILRVPVSELIAMGVSNIKSSQGVSLRQVAAVLSNIGNGLVRVEARRRDALSLYDAALALCPNDLAVLVNRLEILTLLGASEDEIKHVSERLLAINDLHDLDYLDPRDRAAEVSSVWRALRDDLWAANLPLRDDLLRHTLHLVTVIGDRR